jgi:hypothetical protein
MEFFTQDYRVKIRQFPRNGGSTWRWWVFDGRGGAQLDTGIVVEGGREKAESAAKHAVEHQRALYRERSVKPLPP